MFKYLNKKGKKGQSTLEYSILIIIIIGALLTIQVYIKRGVQGRLKGATDDIGVQFSPGNTDHVQVRSTVSTQQDTFFTGISKSDAQSENTTENMNSQVINKEQEFWG